MKNNFTIGVLGGAGTYATIQMFKEYAEIFPAAKEWERPRIIIDNNCTMPSRVLAWQTGERREELIDEISQSITGLIRTGGEGIRIILACNTMHLFVPEVLKKVPSAERYILSIIDNCVEQIRYKKIKRIFLLGSESTIDSNIYQDQFRKAKIDCTAPGTEDYRKIRDCIEAVKQNKFSDEIKEKYLSLISNRENVVLGCTELPVLHEKYSSDKIDVFDPLYMALLKLKEEFDEKNSNIRSI